MCSWGGSLLSCSLGIGPSPTALPGTRTLLGSLVIPALAIVLHVVVAVFYLRPPIDRVLVVEDGVGRIDRFDKSPPAVSLDCEDAEEANVLLLARRSGTANRGRGRRVPDDERSYIRAIRGLLGQEVGTFHEDGAQFARRMLPVLRFVARKDCGHCENWCGSLSLRCAKHK